MRKITVRVSADASWSLTTDRGTEYGTTTGALATRIYEVAEHAIQEQRPKEA